MKITLLILALISANAAIAEEAPAAPAATAAATPEPEKVERYQLKARSSFTLSKDVRPPFWPIGWQRKEVTATPVASPTAKIVEPAGPILQPEHFTVTSVLLGNPAMATINNRSFAQNEILPVVCEGRRIPVVLRAVRDGGVTLEYEGNILFVPLRRSEVPLRSPSNAAVFAQDPSIIIPSTPGGKPK